MRDVVRDVWDSCAPCSTMEQKPLFRVVTEAEKCLTYFENLTLNQLYADLLVNVLQSTITMLYSELSPILVSILHPSVKRHSDDTEIDIANSLIQEFNILSEQVDELVNEIYADAKAEELSLAVTQHTLLNISDVIMAVQSLEEFLLRYKAMCNIVQIQGVDGYGLKSELDISQDIQNRAIQRLALLSARNSNVACRSEIESKILFFLAKRASNIDHSFHNCGNREIVPQEKSFTLSRLIPIEDGLGELLKGTYLSREDLLSHRLSVNIDANKVRTSVKLTELDF